MRLHEAISLGSSLITFKADRWMDESGKCGCAIGMAAASVGRNISGNSINWAELLPEFPILTKSTTYPALAVTSEMSPLFEEGILTQVPVIISGLAYNVRDGKITMEQLIDWVKTTEEELLPKEEDNEGTGKQDQDSDRHSWHQAVREV